ncbi:nicotinate-nucleotide--dimethylbenzimidazole phosphoribosyltransferase [Desulfonatronovibrio magnus]|uniref:nicotinate-nucleotide--dimethylbenzimidazole phosphoribosyltransferase n=1 Tax=Desulfonatronovibrio magnus TaxID=698827 RepID=UPI0005EB580D|nr:nicotinate-nucleotide--dimethylbenzimidazole phosphoribosyltransferase [Desulfonatronovibrio magnus]
MNKFINEVVYSIQPVSTDLITKAFLHLDNLTKPQGSLGRLEEIAAQLYAIGNGSNPRVEPGMVFTCAADHGVARRGTSLYPQEVTRQMVLNFVEGGAAINVLAEAAGLDLSVVDVGVMGEEFSSDSLILNRKVMSGTKDMSVEPAMNMEQCSEAVLAGIDLAESAYNRGFKSLCTGEMGIGNTTAATALFCAFLLEDPVSLSGAGTGLDPDGIIKKAEIIDRTLKLHHAVIDQKNPWNILAVMGGLEIACLTGLIIGGSARRMNIIVDGYISTAAFVCAWNINPLVKDYCFFSHLSAEKGHARIVEMLGVRPVLSMDMRLGEGTGAAMAYFVLKCAADIFNKMATFDTAGVSR